MSAWSASNFDNDDAIDWVGELESTQGDTLLKESLTDIVKLEEEYLDLVVACRALAAAEVVAALRGAPAADLPEEVRSWVAHTDGIDVASMTRLALQAIERIQVDSELKELWNETPKAAEWYEVMADLKTRLLM
jgi:hypothetical protein